MEPTPLSEVFTEFYLPFMHKCHKWLLHHSYFLTGCFSSIRICFDLTNTGECNSLLHYVAIWRKDIWFAGKINGILCMWWPCGGDIMMIDGTVLHLLLKLIFDVCPLSRPLHESVSVHRESSRIQKDLNCFCHCGFGDFFLFCQPFFTLEEGTRLILVLQMALLEV